MEPTRAEILKQAYAAFNARHADDVLALMTDDVHWPKAWEGDYAIGHAAVKDYWTRQWKEIDPHVVPVDILERPDGRVEVEVHQVVYDLVGQLMADGTVLHVYAFEGDKIKGMEIEQP